MLLVGGSSDAAPWSPLELAPAGWFDPSDLGTLWQDTAGTVPVTADGQSVARMDDKSGNGLHAVQATASKRPAYRTDGALHWLQFDDVDDILSAPISITTATLYTAMACNVASGTPQRVMTGEAPVGYPGEYDWNGTHTFGLIRSGGAWSVIRAGGYLSALNRTQALDVATLMELEFTGTQARLTINAGTTGVASSSGTFAVEKINIFSTIGLEGCGGAFYGLFVAATNPASSDLRTFLGEKAGLTL